MIGSAETILISDHALERFVERTDGELDDLGNAQQKQILIAELQRGTPFGVQSGGDELWELPSGLVAAVRPRGDGRKTVVTILTKPLAIANMQSRGVVFSNKALPKHPAVAREEREAIKKAAEARKEAIENAAEAKKEVLRSLAATHFKEGVGKKRRNDLLRALGFDPSGPDGSLYRRFFQEVRLAFYAENRRRNLEVLEQRGVKGGSLPTNAQSDGTIQNHS